MPDCAARTSTRWTPGGGSATTQPRPTTTIATRPRRRARLPRSVEFESALAHCQRRLRALRYSRGAVARETRIATVVTVLAVVAMVLDHLVGDDPGLEDPPAFLIGTALSLAVAAVIFGRIMPRTKRDPQGIDRAASQAIVCSVLGLVTVPVMFLGFPVVLGGGGIALGLIARSGEHKRLATAAIVIGGLAVLIGLAATDAGGDPDDDQGTAHITRS